MPPLLAALPTLAAIAGIAGTGVTTGLEVSGALGGGAGAPPPPAAPKPPDANALLNLKQLTSSADSNTQAQTSGTAGDFFRFIMDQLQAGTTGQPGSAGAAQSTVNGPQQFTPANNQPTNSVVNGQAPNLSDFLSSFTG